MLKNILFSLQNIIISENKRIYINYLNLFVKTDYWLQQELRVWAQNLMLTSNFPEADLKG